MSTDTIYPDLTEAERAKLGRWWLTATDCPTCTSDRSFDDPAECPTCYGDRVVHTGKETQ